MKGKSVLLLLAVTSLLTISCNKDGDSKTPEKPSVETFNFNLTQQPTTLNPLSSTDYYASLIQAKIIESMAFRNEETYEWEKALATDWSTSENGLEFTFTLREGVKWHDGKPFTAEDVKFTFDAIMDPDNKYKTAHMKPYFENIDTCTILEGGKKVKFTAKKKYFGNFDVVAGMRVVAKHLYENPNEEQEKELNKTLIGTGAYKLGEWKRGKYITLERNKEWWGNGIYPDVFKFDLMRMRFIKEGNIAIQRLEKGDLDYNALTAEEFVKKTNGKKWGKSVLKVKYKNSAPKGYGFIAWNLKNDLFKSKKVRKALYHLVDREKMIEKYDYGLRLPATGPWYQQSVYADPEVKPIPFDPKKALEMLREEGWADTDGDQILDKVINGKKTPFSFTILEPNKEFQKYLVTFQQDAKKAGIDVQIKVVEWNTFISLLNERKFEAVRLAWSAGSVDLDPKQIWHSDSSKSKGSNFASFENDRVDALIDQARVTLSREERIPILREVFRIIADEAPYVFLFNSEFGFYGASKNMERPKDAMKYAVGTDYWSLKK